MSSGNRYTVGVAGEYWMSSQTSVRATTEPGVTAMSLPTWNAPRSTIVGMGFPVAMFPVLFAIGRMPGWLAQWQEGSADRGAEDLPAPADYIGEACATSTGVDELLDVLCT